MNKLLIIFLFNPSIIHSQENEAENMSLFSMTRQDQNLQSLTNYKKIFIS